MPQDAADGGLMDFLEGEYEKYEGYDGFRRPRGFVGANSPIGRFAGT